MTTTVVYDATHDNISHLPRGQAAGYTTGTGTHIRWTAADWKAHPGAVRIDQDHAASDPTADILDIEQGAATVFDAPGWVLRSAVDYQTARRPGQRRPAIYCSRSAVTPVVNALTTAGIKHGVGLWVADWNNDQHAATVEVQAAAGPFPVIGRQWRNAGAYDISVFSTAWLKEVSVTASPPAKPPVPPGQWSNPDFWTWDDAYITGTGLDGKLHIFHYESGHWVKLR